MRYDSIKRRREERLRKLREEMSKKPLDFKDEYEPEYSEPRYKDKFSSTYKTKEDTWEDEQEWQEKEHPQGSEGSSFMLKMVISLFLVSATYITYHVDMPFSQQGKEFIGQVMSRDFNFQGAVVQLEEKFGINASILPVLSPASTATQTVWSTGNKKLPLLSPIKGEITIPFEKDGRGVQISTQDHEVKAIEEGWVTFVGNKENLGKTVNIVHKNGTKSTYSGLQEIQVVEGDWVQPGQSIAVMSPGSSLYFSLQMKDQFVDPMSVITFE